MTSKQTFRNAMIAVGLAALLVAPALNAETRLVLFNVPFSFVAGDSVLPAGQYSVKVDPTVNRMRLESQDDGARLYFTVYLEQRPATPDTGTLHFHKYGNTHILKGVWGAGSSVGYDLPTSAAEREMAKTASAREVAMVRALSW